MIIGHGSNRRKLRHWNSTRVLVDNIEKTLEENIVSLEYFLSFYNKSITFEKSKNIILNVFD